MAGHDDMEAAETVRGFIEGQRVFNRYRLERVLGRGGMGVVWLALDEELERKVALKFVPELVCLDKEAIADLKRETRRSLEITHPNIVRIYDFAQDAHTAAISMEYVDGTTLSELKVARKGRLEVRELAPMLKQLCEALDYAHLRAKVVHRDLKPANIMIARDGELKITDFGISCSISDSVSRVSMARGTSGTAVFMSPQQMMGDRPKVTDDIYALGATIFDLLAGKPPFYRGDVLTQLRETEPVSMAVRREELGLGGAPIPPTWEAVVRACLSKVASDRPASAGAVAAQLKLVPVAVSPAGIEAAVMDAGAVGEEKGAAPLLAAPPKLPPVQEVAKAPRKPPARRAEAKPPPLPSREETPAKKGRIEEAGKPSAPPVGGIVELPGVAAAKHTGFRQYGPCFAALIWGIVGAFSSHGGASTGLDVLLVLGPLLAIGMAHSMRASFGRLGFLYAAGLGILAWFSAEAEAERLGSRTAQDESPIAGGVVFFLALAMLNVAPFLKKRAQKGWARGLLKLWQIGLLIVGVFAGGFALISLIEKAQGGP